MGIGAASVLSLSEAREITRDARKLILMGHDPIEERRRKRQDEVRTFRYCAEKYIESFSAAWKNPKHKQQWENTLSTYVYPTIGEVPVDQIETPDIERILKQIWYTKTETAVRVRGRIERILSWAAAQNYRPKENPATWRNNLAAIFPKPSEVRTVKHHRALPWSDVPAFFPRLAQREGTAARALEFLILTAARSGEVRGSTWSEIDLYNRIWTIPADRMKSGREHRVPLSDQAVELVENLPTFNDEHCVFPSTRGGMLSDMALSAVLRRMKIDAVPHGFRSSFKDWCSETTRFPHEVAEMALAHAIPSGVEAAYRRGDLFEKRKHLMEDWGSYCTKPQDVGEVVPIRQSENA